MIKNRQETIAYIIKEARGVLDELLKHGYKVVSVDRMADIIDRIEADWKREREAGAEAAQICGEIGEMIGREAACKQSVTNCNRLGNVAKLHKENINEKVWTDGRDEDACGRHGPAPHPRFAGYT